MVKHFDDERWPLAGLPANAAVVGETRAREWQHGVVCAVAVTVQWRTRLPTRRIVIWLILPVIYACFKD